MYLCARCQNDCFNLPLSGENDLNGSVQRALARLMAFGTVSFVERRNQIPHVVCDFVYISALGDVDSNYVLEPKTKKL